MLRTILAKENCVISGNKRVINIVESTAVYPEDYVQIIKEDELFKILEIHRNKQITVISTENEVEACVYGAIAYKRLFSKDINPKNASLILNYMSEGNKELILELLRENELEDYFSIDYEDPQRISLIKNESKMDVKYAGKYIVKDVSFSRGFIVLSNYSEKLKALKKFYQNELSDFSDDIDFGKISKIYIWGTALDHSITT